MPSGERGPLERALDDPAFLRAFARCLEGDEDPRDALRWLGDPDLPGSDGSPGPGPVLRAAARDLYRPGAGEPERAQHARLERALAASRRRTLAALEAVAREERAAGRPPAAAGAVAAEGGVDRGSAAGRRRRTPILLAGAAAVVLAVLASAWSATHAPAPRASRPVPLDLTTPLAALIEAQPQRLPAGWRDATVVSSGDGLDGSLVLVAPAGQRGRLLLVVRCRAGDRTFRAVISGGETRAERDGVCGGLRSLPLPVRPDAVVRVVVTTPGAGPVSGALVRR